MTPAAWVAFASLMIVVMSGGVTTAVWITIQIGDIKTRLAVVETILSLAYPLQKEQAQVIESARRTKKRFGIIP